MDRWPTFNIADSAVTVGVCILIITLFYDPVLGRRNVPIAPSVANDDPKGIEAPSGSG